MINDKESFKVLIDTETAYKDGAPHVMATGIPVYSQQEVEHREAIYHNVIGFYFARRAQDATITDEDIASMKGLVDKFGRSLLCLIENDDGIKGWAFSKDDIGEISFHEAYISTSNDVNYDVWLKKDGNFWNPVSFLFEEDFCEEDKQFKELTAKLDGIIKNQEQLREAVNKFTEK
jgi:hypothetical protein